MEDEREMMELLREAQLKKERELKERVEKDMIRQELSDLDRAKINGRELEKRKELLRLLQQREALGAKERSLMNEIDLFAKSAF